LPVLESCVEVRGLEGRGAADRPALERLLPDIYQQLRRLARRQLRRGPGRHTLDTTGLVHEAYLKLAGSPGLRLQDPGHLLALTARAMRQVIVTRARARLRSKRGGGAAVLELEEGAGAREPQAEQIIDLDRALSRLRERSEELASLFECRYFGGLSEEETAAALGLSLRAAQRGWMRARAWLRADLEGRAGADQGEAVEDRAATTG
jgi:RNA polymerase sigma-70 factor, ECF subfamily